MKGVRHPSAARLDERSDEQAGLRARLVVLGGAGDPGVPVPAGDFQVEARMSDDKYARYLTGHATARWLVQSEGLGDDANAIVPLIQGLQCAHDAIVRREAQLLVLKLLRWLQAGKLNNGTVQPDQLAELFGVSTDDLQELERKLNEP
jgi:hypothetical protein